MKRYLSILSLLVALAVCLSIAYAEGSTNNIYRLGDKIEDFTVSTYDGQTITLSDVLKEKDMVLINIWATWCGPCRNEFPFMEAAYKRYQEDVEIIALSCEESDTTDVLASFVADMGLTFKVGQDTPNFAAKFGVTGIPTSIVVDRNGVICFVESGSLPDVSSFTRLFDAFVGEGYTEPVLLESIPPMKPNVTPSSEAELAAALNIEGATIAFRNDANQYAWPMVVGEKDGRRVATSSNQGFESSESLVHALVAAKANDVIAVTFKISSAAGCDMMQLRVNGEVVKSFGGEKDWMTYAYPVSSSGEYAVTIAYVNDERSTAGEDTIWLDSVAVLSGEPAAAALAANPVYPVSDQIAIRVLNENAREIVFNDPTGRIAAYYGAASFYLIPDEKAYFALDMIEKYDPETALVSLNFDGSIYALSECIVDRRYVVSCGGDSLETTGYCDSSIYLYPDLVNFQDVKMLTYFKSEENIDAFVNELSRDASGNVLGSWRYADDTAPSANAVAGEDEETNEMSDYTLKCVDQDGNPVAGVMLQVCDESTCQVFISDTNGEHHFTCAPYAWEVHILKAPEGYTADSTEAVLAPVEGGELVFTLSKN